MQDLEIDFAHLRFEATHEITCRKNIQSRFETLSKKPTFKDTILMLLKVYVSYYLRYEAYFSILYIFCCTLVIVTCVIKGI